MNNRLEKAMLVGLYLSKYSKKALSALGFTTFSEAYNVLGMSIGVNPLSIRNYRDEFDPVFPNGRKGWHKRPMIKSRIEMLQQYKDYSVDDFSLQIKKIVYQNPDIDLLTENYNKEQGGTDSFAQRLMTGQAAEEYFIQKYKGIDLFSGLKLEDTRRLGCGFDFKLNSSNGFYAIEVKGLSKNTGSILVTQKEHLIANKLHGLYFLFLVKNFVDIPIHTIYRNPFKNSQLNFSQKETISVQTNWVCQV